MIRGDVPEIDTNPAERWLSARQRRAQAVMDRRRGPLFHFDADHRIADEDRRMTDAAARMEREQGTYDLWASGWTVGPVDDPEWERRLALYGPAR